MAWRRGMWVRCCILEIQDKWLIVMWLMFRIRILVGFAKIGKF